jgi:hypothetical protein
MYSGIDLISHRIYISLILDFQARKLFEQNIVQFIISFLFLTK